MSVKLGGSSADGEVVEQSSLTRISWSNTWRQVMMSSRRGVQCFLACGRWVKSLVLNYLNWLIHRIVTDETNHSTPSTSWTLTSGSTPRRNLTSVTWRGAPRHLLDWKTRRYISGADHQSFESQMIIIDHNSGVTLGRNHSGVSGRRRTDVRKHFPTLVTEPSTNKLTRIR